MENEAGLDGRHRRRKGRRVADIDPPVGRKASGQTELVEEEARSAGRVATPWTGLR
ncbi:MAG: hypothetical protein R3F31_19095 [Verrucomicrobiales bacterium]